VVFIPSIWSASDTTLYDNLALEHLFCSRLIVGHVRPTLLDYLIQYPGTLRELSVRSHTVHAARVTIDPESTGHVTLFNCSDLFEHKYNQCNFDRIVSSIMSLSLALPNLTHIHILIAKPQDFQNWTASRSYSWSLVASLDYFVDQLVRNLTNYTLCDVGLEVRPPEVIQVESYICRPRWIDVGWRYEPGVPDCGLKQLRATWMHPDQRSRIGCDVCTRESDIIGYLCILEYNIKYPCATFALCYLSVQCQGYLAIAGIYINKFIVCRCKVKLGSIEPLVTLQALSGECLKKILDHVLFDVKLLLVSIP